MLGAVTDAIRVSKGGGGRVSETHTSYIYTVGLKLRWFFYGLLKLNYGFFFVNGQLKLNCLYT